jgi:iron-sulfur cluster insertion protein
MITLTQNAKNHLKSLSDFLRFEYEWTFSNGPDDNDIVIEDILLVDKMFELYIVGMELDYVEEIFGSNFVFKNPQAKNTCGCGTSFSI